MCGVSCFKWAFVTRRTLPFSAVNQMGHCSTRIIVLFLLQFLRTSAKGKELANINPFSDFLFLILLLDNFIIMIIMNYCITFLF